MAYILFKDKKYSLLDFESETEFEKAVIENKDYLFGSEAVYLDIKKLMGNGESHHKGIPDGYLIDFFDKKSPQLYFVENELISHDIYRHITEQLARFSAITISSHAQIRNTLLKYIRDNRKLTKQLQEKIKTTQFHNIEELMVFVTEQQKIRIVVAINEETSELNEALNVFKDRPNIAVLQRYVCRKEIVYEYEPMRNEIEDLETTTSRGKRKQSEFDTVVCAAFEEGFKHAYVKSDAWWAIRLSQEARSKLKHLAIYEKAPVGEIKNIAEISHIEPYRDTGKYIVYLKNKKRIKPIKLDKGKPGVAPQAPRFTTFGKIQKAQKISELWS